MLQSKHRHPADNNSKKKLSDLRKRTQQSLMHSILKTLLFLFISTAAISQKTTCNKYIPYFRALNAEKLSHRLTHDLPNDSAKVKAIHCWITHHIKYDLKKSLAFDYERVPVKKILRRRKAICTGYSDLFNELCKHANITSTDIPGYSKNERVDLNDKFYLDEHIWNAVYVNNEWALIDACWDAGYIKPFRRTLKGYVVYVFTLGRHQILRFKPHFRFYPTDRYYFKDGNWFITDHVPSDPLWQLINPMRTIEQCEKDSSFYFNRRQSETGNLPDAGFNSTRLRISSMTPVEKDMYYGPVSYAYNHKNHYPIGISQYITTSDLFKGIDNKSKDTLTVLNQCDSVLNLLATTRSHFDSTIYYLNQQRQELQINNDAKNDTLRAQNKRLISSTKVAGKNIRSVKKLSFRAQNQIKKINKSNQTQLRSLSKKTAFTKAHLLIRYSAEDSLNAARKAEVLLDSIALNKLIIERQFSVLDSFHLSFLEKFATHRYGSSKNTSATVVVTDRRMNSFDDLDFEIRSIKDSILKYKFEYDELLLDSNNVFIVRSLLNQITQLQTHFKNQYKKRKSLAKEYVKLKKYHGDQSTLAVLYNNNIVQYRSELAQYRIALDRVNQHCAALYGVCKKQIKPNRREREGYIREEYVEIGLYSSRSNYIRKHCTALSGISKKKINEVEKMKLKIKRVKKQYGPKK